MSVSIIGRRSSVFSLILSLLVYFLLPLSALADQKAKTEKKVTPPAKIASIMVTSVTSDQGKYKDRAKIGDKIFVKVDSLATLIKSAGDNTDNITLKIGETVFPDLIPLRKVDDSTLEYELVKNEKNSAKWDSLSASMKQMVFPVKVSLAVANQKNGIMKIVGYDFRLILHTFRTDATLAAVVAIMFGITFFKLGNFDARLRSYGPDSPYSLALVQMAVWYCVVTLAYIYLYTINECPPTLNSSILILIGISSATAFGARIVDSSNLAKKELEESEKPAESALHSSVKEDTLSDKMEKKRSNGFFRDILSDEYGFALSRYQIVIWTLIMLYIFVKDVLNLGLMHDFSEGELFLMGISSGSYVGYKLKEDPSKKVKK
jgi:hypothetical protein